MQQETFFLLKLQKQSWATCMKFLRFVYSKYGGTQTVNSFLVYLCFSSSSSSCCQLAGWQERKNLCVPRNKTKPNQTCKSLKHQPLNCEELEVSAKGARDNPPRGKGSSTNALASTGSFPSVDALTWCFIMELRNMKNVYYFNGDQTTNTEKH